MFKTLKESFKFASISGKWMSTTGIDPGDKGQVARKAMEYINNLGLEPEDAWLTSLINWMNGMPWPDSKEMMARGLIKFLNEHEGKIALSAQTVIAARASAEEILG